jgi:hypothetical protein
MSLFPASSTSLHRAELGRSVPSPPASANGENVSRIVASSINVHALQSRPAAPKASLPGVSDRTQITEFGFKGSRSVSPDSAANASAGFLTRLLGWNDDDGKTNDHNATSAIPASPSDVGSVSSAHPSPSSLSHRSLAASDRAASASATSPRSSRPTSVPLTLLSRQYWMSDNVCSVCYDCNVRFSFFVRKHHCRL